MTIQDQKFIGDIIGDTFLAVCICSFTASLMSDAICRISEYFRERKRRTETDNR